MKLTKSLIILFSFLITGAEGSAQTNPSDITLVRQASQRLIFDDSQSIPLATLNPDNIIGQDVMHPVTHYSHAQASVDVQNGKLVIESSQETSTGIWFGGFNPFATFRIDLASHSGEGAIGFLFSDADNSNQFFVTVVLDDEYLRDVRLKVVKDTEIVIDKSIKTNIENEETLQNAIILQMLGSGFTLYMQDQGLPKAIGQSNFNQYIDLRKKQYIHSFQSQLYARLQHGRIQIDRADMALSTGIGQADIRAITYEDGEPFLDQGRLWYTMSIRGRALPHHIQGVFSMNPTSFDIRLEGIILFDRGDGVLRNEIASHIFYDRKQNIWRGLTTGFSAFADPQEEKQILAVESQIDPRFGFSVMSADTFGMIGDIEDPHLIYDSDVEKWRMLTCINDNGYKAVLLESDHWNRGFTKIAGPVEYNSTGTSIQKIGNQRYCFSGSSEREIFIYTYPELKDAGRLKIDLPPWNQTSGTRVWPNVVQLPEGYPVRFVALMMDRFNYPGIKGPHWSYGALYLYHGQN